jgi:cytochrome c nitrite reductase small subunit
MTPDAPARKPLSPQRMIWIAVAAVVVVVCAIPVILTATPTMCGSCHEMQPYVTSWQNSSHREAASNCLVCHTRPGIVSWIGYEAGFYGEIVGHFQGAEVTTTSANAPVVESCLRSGCHSVNRETSNAGDIKISHRLHVIQAKIPCTTCHPGAVHAGVNGRLKLPPMTLCKTCHRAQMQTCSYCHTEQRLQQLPPGVTHN